MHVTQIRNLILGAISFVALYYFMGMFPAKEAIQQDGCWYKRTINPDGSFQHTHADTCPCRGTIESDGFEFSNQ